MVKAYRARGLDFPLLPGTARQVTMIADWRAASVKNRVVRHTSRSRLVAVLKSGAQHRLESGRNPPHRGRDDSVMKGTAQAGEKVTYVADLMQFRQTTAYPAARRVRGPQCYNPVWWCGERLTQA